MTDVVEIARQRRASLLAEVAKLDEFISMAEALLELKDDPDRGTGWLSDLKAHGGSQSEPGADGRGGRDDVPTPQSGADEHGGKAEVATRMPEVAGGAAASESERSDGGANLFAPSFGEENELEHAVERSEDDAGLDAAIGRKLRQRRWMMGMTKTQLAARLGIDIGEIQNFEYGHAHIGTRHLRELATALEVPTSYFFEQDKGPSTDAAGDRDARYPGSEEHPSAAFPLARTA